ncbi:MAG: helix-turn-helix transcriptional regulator [Bacteroides sp.]|nr:helix-turn-helix transcriptional regulator [Bacteroides sp.]
MNEIIQLDSIKAYNDLYGLETKHPLITVVDLRKATQMANHVKMNYGVYALFIKHGVGCTLRYGRQKYDYQEGTVVSFAPGQLVQVEMEDEELSKEVSGLIFHPDLIYSTPLGRKMSMYTFFSYAQSEALHLSEQEQTMLTDCLHGIQAEIEHPVDHHTRALLCVQVELFLNYCLRFYDRQFCTRNKVNSDILQKFEQELNAYFDSGYAQEGGLPSVRYFADKAFLSSGYFGDLIKKETGKTAQEYIQMKLIDRSKQYLLSTNQSISQIAYDLGFQYSQHFIRMFKKQTGYTPKEFRMMND